MLKHCGNYAAILTNYASFLHQKCFSHSPKDIYCKSQSMNNQKHWYNPYFSLSTNICWRQCPQYIQDASWFLLSLLFINIGAFRRNKSWWTLCHWHLHTHGTRAVLAWYATWPYPFWGKSSTMLWFKSCRLCSNLCWHNILKPKEQSLPCEATICCMLVTYHGLS